MADRKEEKLSNKVSIVDQRNCSIDLLRIILAFMVVIIHINANGTGQALSAATLSPWKEMIGGVTALCYPAVNVYVLISGFFMYQQHKSLENEVKSLVRIWCSLVFFSVIGYLAVSSIEGTFSVVELVKRFFPIIRNVWWFYTVYFALALLSPYLNGLIDYISQFEYKLLLIIMLLICSIIPVFLNWEDQIGTGYGYSLIWFFVMYLTGAYISKYVKVIQKGWLSFFKWLMMYLAFSVMMLLTPKILGKIGAVTTFEMYNSVFVFAQAVCIFMAFYTLKVKNVGVKKIIVFLAPLSMASYLLHVQEDIEKILWRVVSPSQYSNSYMIIVVWVVLAFVIFILAAVIEYIRKNIFKKMGIEDFFVRIGKSGYERICMLLEKVKL